MRIGLVSPEYPPLQGGVGDFTERLAEGLATQGHELFVLTRAPHVSGSSPVQVEHYAHWDSRLPLHVARWAAARALDVVNLQYQAAAYRLGLPVHFTTPFWAQLRRPWASVVTYHDLREPYLFPKAGGLRWRALLLLGRWADAVIVTNHEDEQAWRAATPAQPAQRVPIGSNIAPQLPADFDPLAWRRSHGLGATDYVIGCFGFLNATKGVDTLLAALARLLAAAQPARLVLIGGEVGASDPSNRSAAAALQAQIARQGLSERVQATGFLPPAEVSAALRAVDVVALPYRDGASARRGSLLAALVHGCTVVTTLGPGVAAWPELRAATVCVSPDDPEALAGALLALHSDPARRHQLAERAAGCAAAFAWPAIAAQTVAVYARARAALRARSRATRV